MPERDDAPILVGCQDTPEGRDALALAIRLAQDMDAPLVLAAAYDVPMDLGEYEEAVAQTARETLDRAAEAVPEGVATQGRVVAARSPAAALHGAATDTGAGLVVLGSSHRGTAGRLALGSVAERVLHGAPCPVAVAPRGWADAAPAAWSTVGVAYDASPDSKHALHAAEQIALALGAALRLVDVVAPLFYRPVGFPIDAVDRLTEERAVKARERMEEALGTLAPEGRPEGEVVVGQPVEELSARSADLDLLVCGSRGYGRVGQVLLGGLSSRLLRTAACPVVVVPRES
jgi:nucleotide-binding universal stress UspA family protein